MFRMSLFGHNACELAREQVRQSTHNKNNRTPSSQRECLRLWHRFPFPGARQQTFWSDSMSRIDV